MRKSLMLSSTIMLIILFVALSTVTLAWYQAQGGSITVSASDSVSVTTVGPDNPYLIISKTNDSTFQNADEVGTYNTIKFDDSATAQNPATHRLEYFNVSALATNGFTNPINNENGTAYHLQFYIRVTASSFPLSTTVTVTNSDSPLSSEYCYAMTFSGDVKDSINTSSVSQVNSAYHLTNGNTVSAVSEIVIHGSSTITVDFYMWLDGNLATSSNSSLETTVLSGLVITFDDVNIYPTN